MALAAMHAFPTPSTSCGARPCVTPFRHALRHGHVSRQPAVALKGFGKDAVDGWLDLAKLVTSDGSSAKSPYHDLAVAIGRDIYVDVAGWHLFLRDLSVKPGLKMSEALATQLGPQGALRESDVQAVLKQIPVKLGAGKTTVSLADVIPSFCVGDLTKILDESARNR